MRSFDKSQAFLQRAERVIPLGSQTFSKSRTQYPYGVSPYFIERGQGSRVWDMDGNEYIDFINSLASITLGYNDPDVSAAVAAQLQDGVIFSLPHRLECEVAELICEMVPCAEMVRFGKNGSDATAGAVRIARAFTNREHIAQCGYHGWQDWYIGTTARNRGVPVSTRELTHPFAYNDLASLQALFDKHPGQIAGVIMEPMGGTEPAPGFLQAVKDLAHQQGALLIFDETITGFRFANGGAQAWFGVTPDLATFGKGLANGYPVSAIAGRADVMKMMEEVFFSFTFGGEALSLAAAKATLSKLKSQPVINRLTHHGQTIQAGLKQLIAEHQLEDVFSVSGHPTWTFLNIRDARGATVFEIKTLLMQEQHQRGILCLGAHNLSYAHSDADIQALLQMYREVLPLIGQALDAGTLRQQLRCEPLVPLFKVR
ncbi:aminotransferase class III-fold pyridoxal phosphate-dependent enzyme [Aquabacterium sp.]|uniref:aminotransferase class III-fold pyridoxal phosphate-dependent enzyme n=1 Tax=Aquabacterium sp. TaxID=1872578 RepID=UPI002CE0591B|nr:aminotransferase class III-fold pyridoxal phosphate-dependent enzyme [Aquabacterium sp.]HSW04739.1 aminotransferase class III-fold pyridoxal phosphate-dependent enzyme [Aquabacterium sp.]